MPAFAPAEAAEPVQLQTLSKLWNKRELTIDQASGERCLAIVDDFGRSTIVEHGLTTWGCGRENYRILPNDPLSARQDCHWSMEMSRGDWSVRTETFSSLRATRTHWVVSGRIQAFEGSTMIFEKTWDEKVRRKLV